MYIVAITLITVYVAICVSFYLFQHLLFFRPETLSSVFQYKYPFPFEELDFNMEDGGRINAIYFKVPNARGVVYYLKGNSKSIKGWGKFAKDFVSNGYDLFMMDYRGFGKSRGKRSQARVYNDAQYIYKWLTELYPENKIILYGRSWGSGVAAYIASMNKPGMLILDSPYFSFYYFIHQYLFFIPLRLLLKYDLRTDEFLASTECPVHIIHGTSDRLISFSHSEKLKALFPDKVILHSIEGGRHNNLSEFPEFFEILYNILYVKPPDAKTKMA